MKISSGVGGGYVVFETERELLSLSLFSLFLFGRHPPCQCKGLRFALDLTPLVHEVCTLLH